MINPRRDRGSNQRPFDSQSDSLPTALNTDVSVFPDFSGVISIVGDKRLLLEAWKVQTRSIQILDVQWFLGFLRASSEEFIIRKHVAIIGMYIV